MSKAKKRRKIVIFSLIAIAIGGLVAVALLRKREVVITVQTEKVSRRSLTELVVANGKIQPVLQVKISPEVSGEIIELPVKEGQCVQKGDLIIKIKPDAYLANRNQAEASYKSSLAGKTSAEANLEKAVAEFKRNQELYERKLISESTYIDFKTSRDIAAAQLTNAIHQVEMSKANLARAEDDLSKTTIVSPLTGTVSKLNSQIGERVVGTAMMTGTEVMTLADLNDMEARVDIGEVDIVLISPGQNVRLEVDAFKDKKFTGTVTDVANSSRTSSLGGNQEATKFEVKIHVKEKEAFRPGMSVTGEIETRTRTDVLTVPIASVTTRVPKEAKQQSRGKPGQDKGALTNVAAAGSRTNSASLTNEVAAADTNSPAGTNVAKSDKKETAKPVEVVFVIEGDKVKMAPVKIGICDDAYWEITEGLKDGQEIVSGGYRAISRDLEDGKKIRRGLATPDKDKEKSDQAQKAS